MTKTDFINKLEHFLNKLKTNDFDFLYLNDNESNYLFGNRNYGELCISLGNGTYIITSLYSETEEERKAD